MLGNKKTNHEKLETKFSIRQKTTVALMEKFDTQTLNKYWGQVGDIFQKAAVHTDNMNIPDFKKVMTH